MDRIIAGLKRLEVGDYRHHLPGYRMAEFSHIARAVNELTCRAIILPPLV